MTGGRWFLQRYAGLPPEEVSARLREGADSLSLEERFSVLHELGAYAGDESRSGASSSLAETRFLREALPGLLEAHGVRGLLDIPSGDFHTVNLCLPPFGLPAPRTVILENSRLGDGAFCDRCKALWCLDELRGWSASRGPPARRRSVEPSLP